MSETPLHPEINKSNASLERELQQVCDALINAESALICGHARPDGDCLGSQLALYHALNAMGKQARLFNAGPFPVQCQFLPGFEKFESEFPKESKFDLMICLDCGDFERIDAPRLADAKVINIDHHASNDMFGDIVWVDQDAAAVGEMLFEILRQLNVAIDPELAECLLLAIVADTGGFRFTNTTPETFEIAAELTRAGAQPAKIAEELYSQTREMLWLTTRIQERIRFEFDGRFSWSEVTREMLEQAGGEGAVPEGVSNTVRNIVGVEVSVLFHETGEGHCRASFRSSGRIDVSEIAKSLGGGGHPPAAGCLLEEPYEAGRDKILKRVRECLQKQW